MTAPRTEKVTFEGQKRLARQLAKLDKDAPKEMRAVNLSMAQIVAADARGRAPVGRSPDRHPGRLQKSIRAGATKYSAFVKVGRANTPYAMPIHFGWPARGIAPRPFLYDAFDNRREEVIRAHAVGISRLIEKTITRGGDD